jgi:hypothetical protein
MIRLFCQTASDVVRHRRCLAWWKIQSWGKCAFNIWHMKRKDERSGFERGNVWRFQVRVKFARKIGLDDVCRCRRHWNSMELSTQHQSILSRQRIDGEIKKYISEALLTKAKNVISTSLRIKSRKRSFCVISFHGWKYYF